MRAVPCEEILHPVDASNGEMECILCRLRGQRLPGDKQRGEASLGRFGIACACLSQDDLGSKELIACPLLVPPRYSELLVGRHEQIAAWPCREITDNARFDIDCRFCATCVWGVHGPQLCKN